MVYQSNKTRRNTSAILTTNFDIESVTPDGDYAWMASARFTVCLTDEKNRCWEGVLNEHCQFVCR